MENPTLPTCYLIGQDNLLRECAKILRSRSVAILGIISSSEDIKHWAQSQQIEFFSTHHEIDWKTNSADYLFSIANDKIMPDAMLKKIRHFAINYHDAPLPRYAGSHASSWAILENKRNHGVTWHIINERLEGGDILKQITFPILPNETSISLSMKCTAHAITSFSELLDELKKNSIQRVIQDITQRSFFSRSQKPKGNGWVNWINNAEHIERAWRATQMGNNRNQFSLLKVVLRNKMYILHTMKLTSQISHDTPGTLLEIQPQHWKVSTSSTNLLITKITNAHGDLMELEELATHYNLKVGSQLYSPDITEIKDFQILSQEFFTSEAKWAKLLAQFEPSAMTLPDIAINLAAIPQSLFQQCYEFADKPDAVPMILLTAWLIYLHRLEGNKNVGVYIEQEGVALLNVLHPFFANYLPLQVSIDDSNNFVQVIDQVRQNYNHLIDHKTFLNDIWQRYPELNNISPADKQAYRVYWQFSLDYGGEASSLPKPFLTLFAELLTLPDRPIAEIDWLTQAQRQKILVEWNNTATSYPDHKTIHRLFEEQVNKTPNHIALITQERQISYEKLNEQINQLAHYLKNHHHTEPDQLIAVYLDQSHWTLISLLGILKSGAAYLPLDPQYPAHRISHILNETKTKVIISTQTLAQQLRDVKKIDLEKITLIELDNPDITSELEQQINTNPRTPMSSRSLAYVMYTSGASGKPKGIQIEHKGVVNQITWMNSAYPVHTTDRILQKTPYTFDMSVWELFCANWYGATVVLCNPAKHNEPEYLSTLIQDEQITHIQFTPTMLSEFANTLANRKINLNSLRHLFCCGETLETSTVNKIKKILPTVRIHHLFCVIETSACVLSHDYIDQKPACIGKAIANNRAYVLDQKLRPVPIGVSGELHIAGDGVARGYIKQAKLTAQQFISNPFQTEEEKQANRYDRLYKTGYLVCWQPDGNLDFLGRNDKQVKLQSYRIELTEIEHILSGYQGIQQNLVTVIDNHLIAYYVAWKLIDPAKIQAHLAEYLPAYMVPDCFVFLKNFPTTANGKIDRKQLPIPTISSTKPANQAVSEIETQVKSIYAEVLNLKLGQINVTDDFFNLGGNSILAIQLVNRLNQLAQTTVYVKDILELRTIGAISSLLQTPEINSPDVKFDYTRFSLIDKSSYQNKIDLNQVEDIYPASYLQMSTLFDSDLCGKGMHHDVFFCQFDTIFINGKFWTIWTNLIAKHSLLRARFLLNDKNSLDITIYKEAKLDYQFYANQSLDKLIDTERSKTFPHTEECLFHLIINTHADNFDFIFSFHRAIIDSWSVVSLINEFTQAYIHDDFYLENSSSTNQLSYGEFVRNEQLSLANPASMKFWERYLADSQPTQANWRFDDAQTSSGSEFYTSFTLNDEEVKAVHQITKENAITTDCVFLYAYIKTLSFFLNSTDITIGMTFNNRLEKENGNELIGLFLNALPFRAHINSQASLREELIGVFNNKINLHAHKHIPYAHLKSAFNRELYKFGFNFNSRHILKINGQSINHRNKFHHDSTPFMLEIIQTDSFKIELKAHDNYVNQAYLNYFSRYLKTALNNILQNKNEITLDTQDYQKIVIDWNWTKQTFPQNKTLSQLFEEQVGRTPEAVALVFEEDQYTYLELNQHANQLANYLLENYSIRPDDLIALCLDRNELTIISILAVLKAGAAYVPIEPTRPDKRISYILQDTKTRLTLTNARYVHRLNMLACNSNCSILPLDEASNRARFLRHSTENPDNCAKSNHLAYVIYIDSAHNRLTGVMIEHKSIINTLFSLYSHYQSDKSKRVTAYASYASDISVAEIFTVLTKGGELHILDPQSKNINQLSEYILLHKINLIYLPSSVLPIFPKLNYPELDVLTFINNPCSQTVEEYWANSHPFHTYYGPTELTIFSTGKRVAIKSSHNIGRPLFNTKAYVLDNDANPVPVGAIGELYLSGIGIARGYLNDPDLTFKKFIENKFPEPDESQRNDFLQLFRTGDLVRWLPTGDLEFIGCNVAQTKF